MSDQFSYSVLCSGDAEFIRTAAIPLSKELRETLGQESRADEEWPDEDLLGFSTQPRMDLFSPIVLGVFAFVASWAANKFLDEIYAVKIQPRVKEWLAGADESVALKRGHDATLLLSIWYEDLHKVVVVALKGKSLTAFANSVELAESAHRDGLDWMLRHPEAGPVLIYVVEMGSFKRLPGSFATVSEGLRSL